MLRLYYAPRTRAGRPRWLLEELGVPFELVRLDLAKREHKAPAYLAIHPHGRVPALVDGDLVLIESGAICAYLADRYGGDRLVPPAGTPARARYYQWLFYVYGTLEPHLQRYLQHARGPEEKRDAAVASEEKAVLDVAFWFLDRSLAEGPWLCGEQFTAADVVAGAGLIWARASGLAEGHPGIESYVERLKERPAYARAQG